LRVTNPRKFFHVFPPIKGCPSFSHTTDNAKGTIAKVRCLTFSLLTPDLDHDCVLATNGGFFNTHTGGCIGNLVSEGKVISVGEDCKANFGTINGNFVVGYINHTTLKANKFDNLVAGTVFNDMIALI
jgi:hypothetical protein